MSTTRRAFLRGTAATTLGFSGLRHLLQISAFGEPAKGQVADGYGELVSDADGLVDLPAGFRYTVISRRGDTMNDGFRVPAAHDGMGAFTGPDGLTILIRNHEMTSGPGRLGPYGDGNELLRKTKRDLIYDRGRGSTPAFGGTTTLVYDTRNQKLVSHHLSLTGTIRNCAGGVTPWNSWITCEETIQRAEGSFEKDHGYNFEVPASVNPKLVTPVPLKAMGRFNHEAVAVHPNTGIVYQTEDRGDGLIYRYVPNRRGQLTAGGKLQALVIRDKKSCDTRNWSGSQVPCNSLLTTSWIDAENVESPSDDLREQGFSNGSARFARGEGMWTGPDGIYFVCTNGGGAKKGQVWRYVPSPFEGTADEEKTPGKLELFVEPTDGSLVENGDNLTMAPWGDLIVCEDGSGDQHVVGITPQGRIYKFARNVMNKSEFAGSVFSPDGTTLFVNIQSPGLTLAITGPWKRKSA